MNALFLSLFRIIYSDQNTSVWMQLIIDWFLYKWLIRKERVNSLVIRQKGESQNGFFKKIARQIFRKTIISYPLIRTCTCAYQGVRNVCFSENACFVFLKYPFWDLPFCLITEEFQFFLFSCIKYFITDLDRFDCPKKYWYLRYTPKPYYC